MGERIIFVKVAVIGLFILLGIVFVTSAEAWGDLPQAVTNVGRFPEELGIALMLEGESRSRAPAAGRTCARATRSATSASGWARTCRGS